LIGTFRLKPPKKVSHWGIFFRVFIVGFSKKMLGIISVQLFQNYLLNIKMGFCAPIPFTYAFDRPFKLFGKNSKLFTYKINHF